ncbi:MAG: leucine-rich repeat protein, partial [Clostridia bacterium]|nr:leucine-rich repeat protein [Clostridia bacterium]
FTVVLTAIIAAALFVAVSAETYTGKCGTKVTYTFNTSTGVLEISGTGAMTNYSYNSDAPWYSYCSYVKTAKIGDSVTSIGNYAFYDCSSLTSVYYGGDATKWAKISFGSSVWYNTPSTRKVYYYSATQPSTSGNYWRYVDGKPTPW